VPSPPRFIVKCGHLNTENFTSGDFFHFFYRLNGLVESSVGAFLRTSLWSHSQML
jgi:hypothetical protein